MNIKLNEKFFENIQKINEVCDTLIELNNGERMPEVIMFRAIRTIIDPQSSETLSDDIEMRMQQLCEISLDVIMKCENPTEWFLTRAQAIPPYTNEERNALDKRIKMLIEMQKEVKNIFK